MYEFLFIICCSITVIMYRLSKLNLAAVAVLLYSKNSFFFFLQKEHQVQWDRDSLQFTCAKRGRGNCRGSREGPFVPVIRIQGSKRKL
jgi:hypothetical protein